MLENILILAVFLTPFIFGVTLGFIHKHVEVDVIILLAIYVLVVLFYPGSSEFPSGINSAGWFLFLYLVPALLGYAGGYLARMRHNKS